MEAINNACMRRYLHFESSFQLSSTHLFKAALMRYLDLSANVYVSFFNVYHKKTQYRAGNSEI